METVNMKITKFDYIVKQPRLVWKFLAFERIDNSLIRVILIEVFIDITISEFGYKISSGYL